MSSRSPFGLVARWNDVSRFADWSSEEVLARYVAERDEAAFGELLRRHAGPVWAICRRSLSCPGLAEDAFQATFLAVVRKGHQFRSPGSVAAWLDRIARREAGNFRRKEMRRSKVERAVPVREAREDAVSGELAEVIRSAVDDLPKLYRLPVAYRYLAGLSPAEVARVLGLTERTGRTRLSRGVEMLRERLAGKGLAAGAGLGAGTAATESALSAAAERVPEKVLVATATAAKAVAVKYGMFAVVLAAVTYKRAVVGMTLFATGMTVALIPKFGPRNGAVVLSSSSPNERVSSMRASPVVALSALLAPTALPTVAKGQLTVTNLHPSGAFNSIGSGIYNGQQLGRACLSGQSSEHALLWNGTAGSYVDLHPSGAISSSGIDIHGGQQVGSANVGGFNRASLWSGSAESWVNLHPAGAASSSASGVFNGEQVGQVQLGGVFQASLWSGTASSWVSLHPAGATISQAADIHNGQQVGYATIGGVQQASLWSGTASSWVSLNPAGAANSIARDVYNGQQVGIAQIGGIPQAGFWSGTAASWTSLHPTGATHSEATSVFNGWQVGYAIVDGRNCASLWHGTAESWVDLSSVLPPDSSSQANNIWSDGTSLYIVGNYSTVDVSDRAVFWVVPVPEPPGVLAASSIGGAAFVVVFRRLLGGG